MTFQLPIPKELRFTIDDSNKIRRAFRILDDWRKFRFQNYNNEARHLGSQVPSFPHFSPSFSRRGQEERRPIIPANRDALILKQTYRENHLNRAVIRARKLLVDVYFGRAERE